MYKRKYGNCCADKVKNVFLRKLSPFDCAAKSPSLRSGYATHILYSTQVAILFSARYFAKLYKYKFIACSQKCLYTYVNGDSSASVMNNCLCILGEVAIVKISVVWYRSAYIETLHNKVTLPQTYDTNLVLEAF